MAWRHEHDNPYVHIPETTGRLFPPPPPEPKPTDWDYRRRSGGMEVVGLIAASSFLWGISGLLFWGMVAAFASDSAWGLVPLALGVLCWVAAAYVGVKALYRILEFHAEVSAIELVRRWRAAHATDADTAAVAAPAAPAAAGSDASSQNTPGEFGQ